MPPNGGLGRHIGENMKLWWVPASAATNWYAITQRACSYLAYTPFVILSLFWLLQARLLRIPNNILFLI